LLITVCSYTNAASLKMNYFVENKTAVEYRCCYMYQKAVYYEIVLSMA